MQFKYILRFWTYVDNRGPDECWLWTGCCDAWGRGVITIVLDGVKHNTKASRFAFWEANGRWPMPNCNHTCDAPACCNPAHLYEGTQADNMRDAKSRNRLTSIGEKHHLCKLTSAVIPEIRAARAAGERAADIGARYGIGRKTVDAIIEGRTWKHVP